MVDTGEIYHPLRWGPQQALQFLKDVPALEGTGVVVRVPASWRMNRPTRPQVKATVGGRPPAQLGIDALLDFRVEVTLEGETLTKAEIKHLLAQSDGLAFFRGKWIEVDRERLSRTLDQFQAIESKPPPRGFRLARPCDCWRGPRFPASRPRSPPPSIGARRWRVHGWRRRWPNCVGPTDRGASIPVNPSRHAAAISAGRRAMACTCLPGSALAPASLTTWGSARRFRCLSLLLVLKDRAAGVGKPSLLVAPASLLANWTAEIGRFAPSLKTKVVHPSVMPADELKLEDGGGLADIHLVITTYGFLLRAPWLTARSWRLVSSRRGAGHQEPGRQADPGRQAAQRRGARSR